MARWESGASTNKGHRGNAIVGARTAISVAGGGTTEEESRIPERTTSAPCAKQWESELPAPKGGVGSASLAKLRLSCTVVG